MMPSTTCQRLIFDEKHLNMWDQHLREVMIQTILRNGRYSIVYKQMLAVSIITIKLSYNIYHSSQVNAV